MALQSGPDVIDPNLPGEGGQTPLMRAVDRGQIDKIKEFLKYPQINPDVKIQSSGKTALMIAAKRGFTEAVDLLIKAGADLDIQDDTGKSALIYAAREGKNEAAKKLLDAGANPYLRNIKGVSAAMYAAQDSNFDFIKNIFVAMKERNPDLKRLWRDEALSSIDQHNIILMKAVIYLLAEGNLSENALKDFMEGYCSGISSLWLYGRWLQTKINSSGVPRDDNTWFKKTVEMIDRWDGDLRTLKSKDKLEFDRFFQHIHFFQHIDRYLKTPQGDLGLSLEDTLGNKLEKENSIASLLDVEQLETLLEKENFIQDNRLILVSSHDHDTAIFKPQGEDVYYYYDPNDDNGEAAVKTPGEIAKLIFKANHFDDSKSSPLGFRMFSFGDVPKKEYPSQRGLLEDINPSLEDGKNYAGEHTGLIIAATIGDLGSVKYFLDKDVNPNFQAEGDYTALMYAVNSCRVGVVKELLSRKNIDINVKNKGGMTALEMAASRGYDDVIDEFVGRLGVVKKSLKLAVSFVAAFISLVVTVGLPIVGVPMVAISVFFLFKNTIDLGRALVDRRGIYSIIEAYKNSNKKSDKKKPDEELKEDNKAQEADVIDVAPAPPPPLPKAPPLSNRLQEGAPAFKRRGDDKIDKKSIELVADSISEVLSADNGNGVKKKVEASQGVELKKGELVKKTRT